VKKIRGSFCERRLVPKRGIARKSFRWKKSGRTWLLVGCPRGKFKKNRCKVGMRAYAVLTPGRACRRGEKRIAK
jgi:hypothetical protein